MEARVWIGTKGRFNPFQRYEEGTLSLDGDVLTFRGAGDAASMSLSEVEFSFPRSMTGTGFVMKVRGIKAVVYFLDPFAARNAMLESGDVDDGGPAATISFFEGRRAAKPWLKTLRAVAH
jgi:hypothetical protein